MQTKGFAFAIWLWAGAATAQAPLSAIDWLENRAGPVPSNSGAPAPVMVEPQVTKNASAPQIEVAALDATSFAAAGLLPGRVTGLPASLWRNSQADQVAARFARLDVSAHPALTSLLFTLLLAEADAPLGAGDGTAFLTARIDALLALGAVEPAQALLERAGPEHPALFAHWFELSLLTDRATEACATLQRAPHLSRDASVRVFCTARLADWPTAVTILQTAAALGDIDATRIDLLERFLDPELAEDSPALAPPARVDALIFRLYEAIGERLPTQTLPRRFLVADLNGDSGWKAQLEAAERLARVGAISENRLLGLFTDRRAAASGGIWDRVLALQKLDQAVASRDRAAIRAELQASWPMLRNAGLHTTVANLYGPSLADMIDGPEDVLLAQVALLSPSYEAVAPALPANLPDQELLAAVALGGGNMPTPRDPMQTAIAQAFGPVILPDRLAPLMADQRLGEAILQSMAALERGVQGNPPELRDGLLGLRALGLEDTARRTALHLLLVELRP